MDIARYGDEFEPDAHPCLACGVCGLCVGCEICEDGCTADTVSWAYGAGALTTASY